MAFPPAVHEIMPWFTRWPAAAVAVAAMLYATTFALRLTTGTPSEAMMLLLVLPVALLAVTFGQGAGVTGAAVAVGLMVAWAVTAHVQLSPIGWAARALPMLLLGLLLGRAVDRLRASEAERAQLNAAAHWHRQAVEINDSIVQGMSAAKWSLEAGKPDRALDVVTQTLDSAQSMVSQLLRDAELAPGAAHEAGSLAALTARTAAGQRATPQRHTARR